MKKRAPAAATAGKKKKKGEVSGKVLTLASAAIAISLAAFNFMLLYGTVPPPSPDSRISKAVLGFENELTSIEHKIERVGSAALAAERRLQQRLREKFLQKRPKA